MGQANFCCAESRTQQKAEDRQNGKADSIDENGKSKNVGSDQIKKEIKNNKKKKLQNFINLTKQFFKNKSSEFSNYSEVSQREKIVDKSDNYQGYLLYYQKLFNNTLQINYTQQVFQKSATRETVALKQIQNLLKLDHPFVPTFVQYIETATEYKIILNELPPMTLKELMQKEKKFQPKQIQQFAYSLFQLARYFAKKNIICFGFSPENIFIQDTINFKSFKIARLTEVYSISSNSKFQQDSHLYNPDYYFSYELKNQSQQLNFYVDLFAIGVIMLEMATGNHPKNNINNWNLKLEQGEYGGNTVMQSFLQQNKSYMSQAAFDVIQECFQVQQNKRKSVEQILKSQFFNIQEPLKRMYKEFFYKVKMFEQLNVWQRTIFSIIILKFISTQQKIKYEQAFLKLDKKGRGFITQNDFVKILKDLKGSNADYYEVQSAGLNPQRQASQIFSQIDLSGDNEFNYSGNFIYIKNFCLHICFGKLIKSILIQRQISYFADFARQLIIQKGRNIILIGKISQSFDQDFKQAKILQSHLQAFERRDQLILTKEEFFNGIKKLVFQNFNFFQDSVQSAGFNNEILDKLYYN